MSISLALRNDPCVRLLPVAHGFCPEFKQQAVVPDFGGVLSYYSKHRLEAANKIAYRAIEIVDFNAQMSTC